MFDWNIRMTLTIYLVSYCCTDLVHTDMYNLLHSSSPFRSSKSSFRQLKLICQVQSVTEHFNTNLWYRMIRAEYFQFPWQEVSQFVYSFVLLIVIEWQCPRALWPLTPMLYRVKWPTVRMRCDDAKSISVLSRYYTKQKTLCRHLPCPWSDVLTTGTLCLGVNAMQCSARLESDAPLSLLLEHVQQNWSGIFEVKPSACSNDQNGFCPNRESSTHNW